MVGRNWGQLKSVPKAAVALPILVAEWPRNVHEVIRITLSNYRGRIRIDVRVWFRANGDKARPSRRGISLRLKEISDIRTGLRKAREIAVDLGLIDQETRADGER
jgi:hypothetical protein